MTSASDYDVTKAGVSGTSFVTVVLLSFDARYYFAVDLSAGVIKDRRIERVVT